MGTYHQFQQIPLLGLSHQYSILGQVNSVVGVLHHWTSLIIIFKSPRIFYSDSLENKVLHNKASAFWWWISHMVSWSEYGFQEADISIYPLEITVQQDLISYGLFVLNAISHHFFHKNSSLLQSDIFSLVHYQIGIALELLQEGAVSLFLYKCISSNYN